MTQRIHIICDHCGKGRYRKTRTPTKSRYYCSPGCFQNAIKKWKNRKGKNSKINFQNERSVEGFEEQVEYVKARNEWNNFIAINDEDLDIRGLDES